ncbi:MAG: TVP38/TMEM64 family protein [Caldilineaceae bacterium]|nr:TVP38/TMEM64 family protein [Caldilineaceae bacterium]
MAGGVALLLVALFWIGPQIWQLVQDAEALEAWVVGLGWLGPIALIALNAIQIVVAPIPGYVVQVAAGFLFGPLWGGVWGSLGLLMGASMAFWLARFYGRPLAGRLVGHERLDQWERVTHSSSTVVWFVLLLSPIGDLPYFLAGLARVSFIKVLLLTLVVRVPSVFVVAAAGAGVMLLSWWQIALILVALAGLLVVFLRYQDQIVRWSDRHAQQHVDQTLGS